MPHPEFNATQTVKEEEEDDAAAGDEDVMNIRRGSGLNAR
jgi:hypothetical protein